MNDLLARIPLEGWKSLSGATLIFTAGVLRKWEYVDAGTFDLLLTTGLTILGIGLKSGQARTEQKAELAAHLAAMGTAGEVVQAIKADPDTTVIRSKTIGDSSPSRTIDPGPSIQE